MVWALTAWSPYEGRLGAIKIQLTSKRSDREFGTSVFKRKLRLFVISLQITGSESLTRL